MNIEVQVLDPRLHEWGFPSYGSEGSAGLDLFACIDSALLLEPQGPAQLISSGISIRIGDPNWCGLILPRSGKGHGDGLVLGNGVGVVDADYEGPCLISAWNRNSWSKTRDGDIVINPGDRIAQMLFIRVSRPKFTVVSALSSASKRGQSGFGSTGR
jgi:dUTP pyrophosphatase